MFQFTTTTIINSNLDSNGVTAKFAATSTKLDVTRVGSFKKANTVSIYKRAYQAGVKEIAQITMPSATEGDVIRLEIWLKLSQQTNSEFANTYLEFQKPVVVEVLYATSAIVTATALVTELNKLRDRFGYTYVTATNAGGSSATITLTVKDDNQRFKSVIISNQDLTPNSIIQPEYTTLATGSVTTPGKLGFGDDNWMVRSITLPTAENTRYFGINKEERPIIGGNYSQYTLRYSIDKDGTDGIVGNGKSVTTHVFYVLSTLVSAFESALATFGISYLPVITGSTTLTNSTTSTYVASNAIGAVTWATETALTGCSINATTGVVTTGVTDGTYVISATDSVGNKSTFSITVA